MRSTGQIRKASQIQVFLPLGGAICQYCHQSGELSAGNTLTPQPSTSTSIKVWALDGCTLVTALPCSSCDAQCPRGMYTRCHSEDWLEQMLCRSRSPEGPCATLAFLWDNISASVPLGGSRVGNRVRPSPGVFSFHWVLCHTPDWLPALRIQT